MHLIYLTAQYLKVTSKFLKNFRIAEIKQISEIGI